MMAVDTEVLSRGLKVSMNVPSALIPGRSGFEKRQALRRLAANGIVREVQPDTWALNGPWRGMRNEPLELRKAT